MRLRRDRLAALLTILPSLVLLGIFVYGFIFQTVRTSLTDWGSSAAMALKPQLHNVGLLNYRELFSGILNFRFRQDLVNMLWFTLLFVAATLGAGLLLATLIDQRVRGEGIFRTVFLLPMSLSFVVTGTIWRWLLQPGGGVNAIPALVGLKNGEFLWVSSRDQVARFDWQSLPFHLLLAALLVMVVCAIHALLRRRYNSAVILGAAAVVAGVWILFGGAALRRALPIPEVHGLNLALIGVVLAATWQMSGYTMALYLAGLRTVPDEIREAARVDGANRLQVYWYVELPFLAPITWSGIIILGHIALKIFDLVFALTGPDHVPTSVPAISMYLTTFRGNQLASGASIAAILLLLVSVLIIPYLITSFRQGGER